MLRGMRQKCKVLKNLKRKRSLLMEIRRLLRGFVERKDKIVHVCELGEEQE